MFRNANDTLINLWVEQYGIGLTLKFKPFGDRIKSEVVPEWAILHFSVFLTPSLECPAFPCRVPSGEGHNLGAGGRALRDQRATALERLQAGQRPGVPVPPGVRPHQEVHRR